MVCMNRCKNGSLSVTQCDHVCNYCESKRFWKERDDREMKGKCLHMHAEKGSHEQDNEPMQIMLAGV